MYKALDKMEAEEIFLQNWDHLGRVHRYAMSIKLFSTGKLLLASKNTLKCLILKTAEHFGIHGVLRNRNLVILTETEIHSVHKLHVCTCTSF